MAQSAFSPNWFRVATLRPRLRAHARTHRQVFRGADWYVLQNDQTGQFHRISATANHMVGLMTGRRTVEEIWQATLGWMGSEDDPPTQDDVIRLLSQLHAADLLAGDVPPDLGELAHRAEERARKAMMARLRNPLALRLPMIDPDRFLTATLPLARPFFTLFGALVWLGIVGAGAVIAVLNWGPLTETLVDQVLLAENLVLLALTYPVVKAVHELGHGYAAKVFGGAVHEMGLMFLVLIPVPYVDASTASGFASKWQRALVGGAGILVELALAGIAMIVWVNAEPGLVRAAALNVALIGGVSTLLFNGNPLLRFDGYYVLADLVEIPNLGTRANRHVQHLIKRHAFGLRDSTSPATARGERAWFVVYAVAAAIYRLVIMVVIALFIATKLFFVGVLLAAWAVWMAVFWPLLKGLWWIWDSPELGPRRGRAVAVTGGAVGALAGAVLLIPLPYATTLAGVVALPEDAHLRAGSSGVLAGLGAAPDETVAAGHALYTLRDPDLSARRAVLAAQRREFALRLAQERTLDATREAILQAQLDSVDSALRLLDGRIAALEVTSPHAGRFIGLLSGSDTGRYMRRGTLMGYVLGPGDPFVRAVVPPARADLVYNRAERAELRLAEAPERVLPADLVRATPKAQRRLPSAALGTTGGGPVPVDPASPDPARPDALEPVFLVDLDVALPPDRVMPGMRAHVRIDHGSATLAERLGRELRQLFLRRFDV
jgi:putative peptide zinc metalloprotease protein